jgi:hypothetical protein
MRSTLGSHMLIGGTDATISVPAVANGRKKETHP